MSSAGFFLFFCVSAQHFPGIGQRKLCDMVAGDEAGQRLYTAILVQRVYLGIGTLVRDIFLNEQMAVGQRSDLRRMSDAEDLMTLGALTQYLADTAGCFARYAAVDLVIDDRRNGVFISHCVFNGEGNTAQLTA